MTAPRRIGDAHVTSVQLTADSVRIVDLNVDDREVLDAARRAEAAGEPLNDWLVALLRAGAVALAAVGSSRDLRELNATVERTGQQMDEAIRRSSDQLTALVQQAVDPELGTMAIATRAQIDRLSDGVARLVTGRDAVLPSSVRASVEGVTSAVRVQVTEALSASVSQLQQAVAQDRQLLGQGLHSLLVQHTTSLTQQLTELRTQLAETATPRTRSSAAIGAEHEDVVLDELCRIAQGAGDLCSSTARVTGTDGVSKVGDFVLDLANPRGGPSLGRIVAECKARAAPMSSVKLLEELRAAKLNRQAQAGLIICASADMLPGRQSLIVLSDCDLAVAWSDGDPVDILRAAFLLLKLGVARGAGADLSEMDVPELRLRAARAVQHLAGFDKLERLTASTGKSLRAVTEQASVLRNLLTDELDALSTGLSNVK